MPNSRPTLTGLTTAVTFEEQLVNGAPQLIDTDITFADADANFTGATLTVRGALAEDTVAIRNQGLAAGQIAVSGVNVLYGGVIIGSFSGGTAGATLAVTFNASATVAGIDALIQNLTYANSSNTPTGSRDLIVSFNDAAGAALRPPLAFSELVGLGNNPFHNIHLGTLSTSTFGDLDGDGDLDMLLGYSNGWLIYFRNLGSAIVPDQALQTGGANPLNGVDVGVDSAPAFADLDGDGDLDLVVGSGSSELRYFRNTGTATAAAFTEQVGAGNPFDGLFTGYGGTPALADLDGDGDLDALIGEYQGSLRYFRNTGTATAPIFSEQVGAGNPFNGVDVGDFSAPAFADLDGDGDYDVLIGEYAGTLRTFLNTGSSTAPQFSEQTAGANPFDGVDVGNRATPGLADLDGDGDLDVIAGTAVGTLRYFRNTEPGQSTQRISEVVGPDNPFNGIGAGMGVAPTFSDLDRDGDLDALTVDDSGLPRYFRNTGTVAAPAYTEQVGSANPFNGVILSDGAPGFADLDGDGDLDLVVGHTGGTLRYFRNLGNPTSPAYTEAIGGNNPLNGIDVNDYSAPALADLDGDGDLDVLVGSDAGTLRYFRNTGSAINPVYTEQVGAGNPFIGVDVGYRSAPSFADLDGDGDLDTLVGAQDGMLRYFRNTGTAIVPTFMEQTGAANPLNGVDVGYSSAPSFADLDGDGDLDVIVGENDGTLNYFRNDGAGFVATVNITAQNENPFTSGNDTVNLGTLDLSTYYTPDVTNALGGADVVTLSSTQNLGFLFSAGPGTDSITGGSGGDWIAGDSDNDTINGGGGVDIGHFGGNRANYHVVTTNVGGTLTTTVTDAVGSGGVDRLTSIEQLSFFDAGWGFAGANLNLRGNSVGSRFDSVNFHNDSTGQSFVHIFDSGARTGSGALTGNLGAHWNAIDTADMNSDGITDVIYKNAVDGTIQIGTSSAGGITGFTTLTTALSTTWRLVGAADVDGDAYTDLIIQNNANGFIYSADFTNLTFNGYLPVSGEGTVWQARALGDVNRDGRADIIYQNTTTTEVVAGLMTASSTISSYLPIATVGNWTVKEAADMNKDGYLDVLIQNNANGDISYANMAGGVFSGYGTVMNGFGTAWQLEGMADTNNDGDIDAVIRNVLGSSDTYVVNMEAGGFQSFTLVAQGIGSQWYVI